MTLFNHLRIILTAIDDDWPSVITNLQKARKSWSCLPRILGRDKTQNFRLILTVSSPGIHIIWRGDMGDNHMDWTATEELQTQGDDKADGYANLETDGWDLGLPLNRKFPAGDEIETMETYISRLHNTVIQ